MDFWQTLAVLIRRWYVTVPAFCATLAVAAAAYAVVPVSYQSDAVLVLTTPLAGGSGTTGPGIPSTVTNPLMNFDRSLSLSAAIVIQQMNDPETTVGLGITPGGSTSYRVTNGSSNPELLETGPFLFIQANASKASDAQDLSEKVADEVAQVLEERQTELDAPPSTHISLQVVVPPTAGRPLGTSRMRAAAAALALAGLMSLTAVYAFENLMTYRRRRRHDADTHGGTGPDDAGPGGSGPGLRAERDRLVAVSSAEEAR